MIENNPRNVEAAFEMVLEEIEAERSTSSVAWARTPYQVKWVLHEEAESQDLMEAVKSRTKQAHSGSKDHAQGGRKGPSGM